MSKSAELGNIPDNQLISLQPTLFNEPLPFETSNPSEEFYTALLAEYVLKNPSEQFLMFSNLDEEPQEDFFRRMTYDQQTALIEQMSQNARNTRAVRLFQSIRTN